MTDTARLIIERGIAGAPPKPRALTFRSKPDNPCSMGLRWIRMHKDPTLAFRFSCISANACKECMMRIDGKVVYACLARLEARDMHLAPLANKTLVRDLVTDIAPPAERL